jgi:hypothetical protein
MKIDLKKLVASSVFLRHLGLAGDGLGVYGSMVHLNCRAIIAQRLSLWAVGRCTCSIQWQQPAAAGWRLVRVFSLCIGC